jgi:hypothetical protein
MCAGPLLLVSATAARRSAAPSSPRLSWPASECAGVPLAARMSSASRFRGAAGKHQRQPDAPRQQAQHPRPVAGRIAARRRAGARMQQQPGLAGVDAEAQQARAHAGQVGGAQRERQPGAVFAGFTPEVAHQVELALHLVAQHELRLRVGIQSVSSW